MSNSIMMRLIKCLSVIMLVIGCVQPTSVQAYSPVLTETVQNTNNTNKNASVTVQGKEQPKQNTFRTICDYCLSHNSYSISHWISS